MVSLPIDRDREAVLASLRLPGLSILRAPAGSGKSTRVPVFLREDGLQGKILCVQPRRVAARALARRVAAEQGVALGEEVGYRVRFENRTTPATRIVYASRGVFLQELLADPRSLDRYGAILLDEFHERQLETDWIFGLLCREHRAGRVLRVGILSATLDPDPIRAVWGEARSLEVAAPTFPVEVRHFPRPTRFENARVVERAVETVAGLAREGVEPDYLVFLPGYREVRRTVADLRRQKELKEFEVLPLTGEQSPEEQDRAVRAGERPRVIVATNIAESSLTVGGVRTVVDGGLVRRNEYDPARGLNALRTETVSLFSADQRAGRAGRIAPGTCVRLWAEREEAQLARAEVPECQRLDLAEWMLRSVVRGEAEDFPWIDRPPETRWQAARSLLRDLGAVEPIPGGKGSTPAFPQLVPTARGSELARFPVHPRLAAVLLEARELGVGGAAAVLVALLEEGSLIAPKSEAEEVYALKGDKADFEADLRFVEAFRERGRSAAPRGAFLAGADAVVRQAKRMAALLRVEPDFAMPDSVLDALRRCCLAGFADRLAQRTHRGSANYRLADGTVGRVDREVRAERTPWAVVLESREAVVKKVRTVLFQRLVVVEEDWIRADLADRITTRHGVEEDSSGRLFQVRARQLGELELDRETLGEPEPGERAAAFAEAALAGTIPLRQWTEAVEEWLRRLESARHFLPEWEWPPFDTEAKRTVLELIAHDCASVKAFRNAEILPVLGEWLSPEQREGLERLVPSTYPVPGRRRPARLDYADPLQPRLSVTIGEAARMEGGHPAVGEGRIPLLVELLAPNRRPVQVTADLPAFWQASYPAIRKELQGRYPKHPWPEVAGGERAGH